MNTKILVVDDEPDFVRLLVFNLNRAGFDVLEAVNGLDAVHLARRHLPDIVLLDVMMPQLDGFSVCEVLGRNEITARIPVVYVDRPERSGILRPRIKSQRGAATDQAGRVPKTAGDNPGCD